MEYAKAKDARVAQLTEAEKNEFVKTAEISDRKHIIAWDPDFVKLTEEKELLEKSDAGMKNGEYVSEE